MNTTTSALRDGLILPSRSAAPLLRWWWFGPSVERPELDRELTAMAAAGFAGVEVAYVYPLGPATDEFLSPTFLADLLFAAERAAELGLRFDLTLCSGWPFGGPYVSDDLAARQLHWEGREIPPGPLSVSAEPSRPGRRLVAGYLGAGSAQEPPETYEQLPLIDDRIEIAAEGLPHAHGPRYLLLAYDQPTGQNVKRATVGAEGPALDHYSAAATRAHLAWAGDRLLDAVPAALIGSVFCDSLEVYEADWTPSLPSEFARRRGYPLLPVLPLLRTDSPDAARVRADYHRTLAELFEENFVAECQRWAAERGVPFRLQGYGVPPARLSSYRFADQIEGEGWGWREITPTRWAASAARHYGRSIVSAEVWTWVHSPSFRATPLDLKGEAHEHLLNGINQFVGHGWPYSPSGEPGLGWFFYAAGAIDDRSPWWPAMPELNAYLSRLCWLLRQGEPVREVAVFVPNEDLFAVMGRAAGGSLDTWREANRRIGDELPATIREAGLDFDLIDEDVLATSNRDGVPPDRYRVVVIPPDSTISAAVAGWLDQVVAAGGAVVSGFPADLAGGVVPEIERDLSWSPATRDLGFIHRRLADGDLYLLANTGPQERAVAVSMRRTRQTVEVWDAVSGQVVRTAPGGEPLELTLDPYEAVVLVATDDSAGVAERGVAERGRPVAPSRRIALDQEWECAFPGTPAASVTLPHVWEDQSGRRHYSGTASYTTGCELPALPPESVVRLDLGPASRDRPPRRASSGRSYRADIVGPIGEIAQVRVNGIDCGVAWAPPYTIDISAAVRPGPNAIEIVVANTAANALAGDPEIGPLVATTTLRYGRRFRLQEVDRALDSVRSGLLTTPAIVIG